MNQWTELERNGEKQKEKDRNRQKQTETERNGEKQTETDRNGQKRTETEGNAQKWTETYRKNMSSNLLAFFGLKIEKIAFNFGILVPLMNTK